MSPASTLDIHIDLAVKRYSMLFTLPSQRRVILILFLLSIVSGILSVLPLSFTLQNLLFGLFFGFSFFLIVAFTDVAASRFLLRNDVIYNLRRCLALSLFSSLAWLTLSLIGGAIFFFIHDFTLWFKLNLIGFSAATILRLIVLLTTAFHSRTRILVSALLQPVLCLIPLYVGWSCIGNPLTLQLFLFVAATIPIAIATAAVFIFLIDRVGKKNFGISSFALLKAFLANWTEDLNAPLEEFFERLGSKANIEFSVFGFKTGDKVNVALVVPSFHPGPFKNVGSSPLPHMIQETLSKELDGAVAVAHGVFGHELDLASQAQNQKMIDRMLKSLDFKNFFPKASPFIQVKNDVATASCQILGKHALLTLTLAPQTTEDFPKEIGSAIIGLAEKHGLASADIINAHNSINGPFNMHEALDSLQNAAALSLEKALKAEQKSFKIGFAQVFPKEFHVEDGMGPGGINVLVVQVDAQKAAYVIIDGNNMVSGLREEILTQIREEGISDGEVLTTDTHVVSAIVIGKRGYHPVGEAMSKERLIAYIRQAVRMALDNMKQAQVSRRHEIAEKVKVIGEKQIENMCLIAEKSAKKAKQLALTVFPITAFLLISLLFLL